MIKSYDDHLSLLSNNLLLLSKKAKAIRTNSLRSLQSSHFRFKSLLVRKLRMHDLIKRQSSFCPFNGQVAGSFISSASFHPFTGRTLSHCREQWSLLGDRSIYFISSAPTNLLIVGSRAYDLIRKTSARGSHQALVLNSFF